MPAPDCIDTMVYGSSATLPELEAVVDHRHAQGRRGPLLLEVWAERHRGRRQLLALCGRMRRDLGLSDADIWAEGRKPFWRP